MQCSRGRTDDPAVPGTAYAPHSGEVLLDKVLGAEGVFVNAAMYAPGARTYWHTHQNGQLIFVTSGTGTVVTRDGQVQLLQAGDVVYTPPGEEHWHGAAPDCFITYTSVSLGGTVTYDEVPDDQYSATWQ
jgi:quercetin dioxygenase-like cupin family protein